MRWKTVAGIDQLEIIDTYRSFVKPTWKPQLTEFCTGLTGITQVSIVAVNLHLDPERIGKDEVDHAPPFTEVVQSFTRFLAKHGLIDTSTGHRLVQFCWCTDGPYDVRDFVAKQCFFSKVCHVYHNLQSN